jgi:hypothetical protein
MIERLVLARPHFRRNRLIPFLGVVEGGIDVENYAAERKYAVLDDLPDLELGLSDLGHLYAFIFDTQAPPKATRESKCTYHTSI